MSSSRTTFDAPQRTASDLSDISLFERLPLAPFNENDHSSSSEEEASEHSSTTSSQREHDKEPVKLSRVPPELQAVFLLSGRGETLHDPPPESYGDKVYRRRWRIGRTRSERSIKSTTSNMLDGQTGNGQEEAGLRSMFQRSVSCADIGRSKSVAFGAPSTLVYDKKTAPRDTCLSVSRWQTVGRRNSFSGYGENIAVASPGPRKPEAPVRKPLKPTYSSTSSGTATTVSCSSLSFSEDEETSLVDGQVQKSDVRVPVSISCSNDAPKMPSRSGSYAVANEIWPLSPRKEEEQTIPILTRRSSFAEAPPRQPTRSIVDINTSTKREISSIERPGFREEAMTAHRKSSTKNIVLSVHTRTAGDGSCPNPPTLPSRTRDD